MRKTIIQEMKQETLSLTTDITYAQVESWFGGTYRDLKMSIIFPKFVEGHEKLPAIVWLCGGGFYRVDENVWLPQMVSLAQRGFVMISPEYRISDEAPFPYPLMDVKASIRYLRAHADKFCVDPERVFIMGESAGGTYSTLCSVTNGREEYDQVGEYQTFSSSVQGVADFYGLVDFSDFTHLMNTPAPEEDAVGRAAVYYRDHVEEGSAILHVDANTPPTIIFHGDQDELVPLSQSERYYERLQEDGVRSDLYVVEGAIHGDPLFYQENIYDLVAAFFKEIGR